jgi:hypothetical protein
MIAWQVADLNMPSSELWYALLEKEGNSWRIGIPRVLTDLDGVATQVKLESFGKERAAITWLNTSRTDVEDNAIMMADWDGGAWSDKKIVLDRPGEYYNYVTTSINNDLGGLLATCFIEDVEFNHHEKLLLLPWDHHNGEWNSEGVIELFSDSLNHLQLPSLAVDNDGSATIIFKREEMKGKDQADRISQLDLLSGSLDPPSGHWIHYPANDLVCDTLKQVADLQISYVGNDTLILLLNEFPPVTTNVNFEPLNGIFFGDPYMNLVMRSFSFSEDGSIQNVDEGNFFTGIPEYQANKPEPRLYQNYPNPCNEYTIITFDIPERKEVKLELFEMSGNRVAVLTDNTLSAGRYDLQVNTSLLKPGTYIYTLTTNESRSSLRMIVGR